MIKTKEVTITTTNRNISHYRTIFSGITSGQVITISPNNLPELSRVKIVAICDVCGKEKTIMMGSYRRNYNEYGYYACGGNCSLEKTKSTSIRKYGVTHSNKTSDFITKVKKTKLEKYGDENYVNIEKQKQTNLERFGTESYMMTNEFKERKENILLEKYGTIIPLRNQEIKEKWIKTNLKKYDTKYPTQNELIKEKIYNSKLSKYNDGKYNNRIKYKNTSLNRYGFDNPMKSEMIKDRLYNSMYRKYGEKFSMHIPEIVNKMIKSGIKITKFRDTDIYFQSTYEKDFLDKYYDILDIKRGPTVKYIFSGKTHIYYPDFYVKELNLIVEIKSTNWYNVHKEKNECKKFQCIEQGYNFIFILDKNYEVFNELIKHVKYSKEDVCYQYKIKQELKNKSNIIHKDYKLSDFIFKYVDSSDKKMCQKITEFIETYEWLGKMPNRPTHRFVAMYGDVIGAVIIMSIPNSFSNLLGENTKNIEKLISRGANAYWTPKNTSSSLIMWSIKWMVKNTQFRVFSAYSDTEAKEIGTIYQACNFIYLGQEFGSKELYFDINNPKIGWTTGRNFRKLSFYKKACKEININWEDNWNDRYSIKWDNMPIDIKEKIIEKSKNKIKNSIKRKSPKKHKYVYILGCDKKETKKLLELFRNYNPKYTKIDYPKR